VNASVDVSTIVNKVTDRSFDVAATPHSVSVDESNRGEVSVYYPLSGTRHYAGSDRREMFFFPCYRQRTWVQHNQPQTTVLQMGMPTNVKKVRAVKLMGYSLSHKRTIGVQHTHEQKEEDWYAIRIKELRTNSAILSNNSHANGALHVLHCGRSPTLSGKPNSAALYQYDADGLSCVAFSPVNLPTITVEVVDRLGGEAHFGRTSERASWRRGSTTSICRGITVAKCKGGGRSMLRTDPSIHKGYPTTTTTAPGSPRRMRRPVRRRRTWCCVRRFARQRRRSPAGGRWFARIRSPTARLPTSSR
jgi:hypothetical protein